MAHGVDPPGTSGTAGRQINTGIESVESPDPDPALEDVILEPAEGVVTDQIVLHEVKGQRSPRYISQDTGVHAVYVVIVELEVNDISQAPERARMQGARMEVVVS